MTTRERMAVVLIALGGLIAAAGSVDAQGRSGIVVPAASFVRAMNVAAGSNACGNGAYGAGVILNVPPCGSVRNAVEYEFVAGTGGRYELAAEYAAVDSRPVTIAINGVVVMTDALRTTTGCWTEHCQRWFRQDAIVELRPGTNTMRIERDSYFPHIRAFRFIPVD